MLPPIKAISVACQNCGSPLQLASGLRFVTCNYCASELEIVHDSSTTHSVVLKRLENKVDANAKRLRIMELRLAIDRLDKSWEKARETYLIDGRYGEKYEPEAASSYLVIGFVFVIGLSMVSSLLFSARHNWPTALFGLAMLGYSIYHFISVSHKTRDLESAQQRYESRRRQLSVELRSLEQDTPTIQS